MNADEDVERASYRKTIVCLANSRKMLGVCVAGLEQMPSGFAGWIRPVSNRKDRELSSQEIRCSDGGPARLLDLLEIQFEQHQPEQYQTENHLIDGAVPWVRCGRLANEAVGALCEAPPRLWIDGKSSTHGINDEMGVGEASRPGATSLVLIKADDLKVIVQWEGYATKPPVHKVRADFAYRGTRYRLALTDPALTAQFKKQGGGIHEVENPSAVCVSISEPLGERCFKLAAAIIPLRSK